MSLSGVVQPAGAAAPITHADQPSFGHRSAPPDPNSPPVGVDPLHAGFDAIWDRTLRPDLVVLEQARQRSVMVFALAVMAAGLAAWSEHLFLAGAGRPWAFEAPFLTVVLGATFGFIPLARTVQSAKSDVIGALCGQLGVAYRAGNKTAPAFETFLELNLLPHPSSKQFSDFLLGRRGRITFTLCQARLWQGSGKNRTCVFNGQLLALGSERTRAGTTAVLRQGFMAAFACPKGLSRVGLEDPRFAKVFEAFGSDQVEAREILTPAFMQRLLDLESAYCGEKLRCAFKGSEILVALEGGACFRFGSAFSSFVDRDRAQAIAHDLEQVFRLIDSFAVA